jgi:hypothetical protein
MKENVFGSKPSKFDYPIFKCLAGIGTIPSFIHILFRQPICFGLKYPLETTPNRRVPVRSGVRPF